MKMKDNNSFIMKPTPNYKIIGNILYQSIKGYDSDSIKKLLRRFGPMVIDIWGDSKNDKLHKIARINDRLSIIKQPTIGTNQNGKNVKVDHDVLLVGYGVTSKNQKYWILQNSWSSDWAYKGFFGILDDNKPTNIFSHFAYVTSIDFEYIKKKSGETKTKPVEIQLKNASVVEYYKDDIITETGSIPPPAGNDELNTFYSMLQTVPEIKRSSGDSIYENNICWANDNNPLGKSIVVPTKSQGSCGSCWIFAAMGMIQSAISKETRGKELFSLSEQWVLNSIDDAIKEKLPGWGNGSGCKGGNTDMFKVSINGFQNYGQRYGSFGLKSEENCPYNCQKYYKGDTDCADGNKCGPSIKQNVQKSDDDKKSDDDSPVVKNLKKIWKDNNIYIIIGIAVVIVLIIIFSMQK